MRTWWPGVRAEIRDVADGIDDAHAILATCWESVYPVMASPARGARLYFVQDFEPSFYPAGSEALLAEATYRFGFHGVTAGRWLADKLTREYDMAADHFDFGCDLDRYQLDDSPDAARARTGVCYYCRPSTPRRAHETRHGGTRPVRRAAPGGRHPSLRRAARRRSPFRATQHGLLTPDELNELYNRCVAGLTLSATNVSLVPHEMLAAGCLPVVNDADNNRLVLANDHVVYAPATPFELAAALSDLVSRDPADQLAVARAAAGSVAGSGWAASGRRVEEIVRSVVLARQP